MVNLQAPDPASLFVALLHSPVEPVECIHELTRLFGPVSHVSPAYEMGEFSGYYEREMGAGLKKQFLCFAKPVCMDQLAECKLAAHAVERRFEQEPGKRVFNIDPGLVTSYSVILSTRKNQAHRIYLRDGVFAEVTLIFRKGRYRALPWTYPDYQSALALQFFEQSRPGRK